MGLPEKKKQIQIRKALARAECFWGIICKAGITSDLGGKIVDNVPYDKLTDKEKLTLVKVSTHLVKGSDEINQQFSEAEEKEKQETAEQEKEQVQIDPETETEETNSESESETQETSPA